eukprot:13427030-Heterocapsa_arctica.AAC.1
MGQGRLHLPLGHVRLHLPAACAACAAHEVSGHPSRGGCCSRSLRTARPYIVRLVWPPADFCVSKLRGTLPACTAFAARCSTLRRCAARFSA